MTRRILCPIKAVRSFVSFRMTRYVRKRKVFVSNKKEIAASGGNLFFYPENHSNDPPVYHRKDLLIFKILKNGHSDGITLDTDLNVICQASDDGLLQLIPHLTVGMVRIVQ